MWVAALRHTETAGDLAALQVVVSTVMELALGRSLDKTFQVEVVDELVIEFLKLEEQCLWLEWPSTMSHPIFKAKTRCSSYICPGSSCHTYGQNVSTEYQCLYYIISYYKNLLQVQKGLNSGMDPILPQAVDRGFYKPRRNLHPHTPHLLSSRT
jgi:hypothetical protein